MKKKYIFFSLLCIIFIYMGSDVYASNNLTKNTSSIGQSLGEMAIRQASATQYEIYLYMHGDSYSIDLDQNITLDPFGGESLVDYFKLVLNQLNKMDIDPYPENGSIYQDDWTVEYTADYDYIGTDYFTLNIDNEDGDSYIFKVTVLIGEADTPNDFQISINYNTSGTPQVTDVSWSGVYTANASYTLGYTTFLSDAEDSKFTDMDGLTNISKEDLKDIEFSDLSPQDSMATRHYIAMKTTRYIIPDNDESIELPYAFEEYNTKYLASEYSDFLIIDEPGSSNPPNSPTDVTAKISGPNEARVTFSGNQNMLDFKAYEIRYWIDNGIETEDSHPVITVSSPSGSTTISNLEDDTTYNFKVTAVDYDNNPSNPVQVSLLIEETYTTLQNPDLFEGGCFIADIGTSVASVKTTIWLSFALLLLITLIARKKSFIRIFMISCIVCIVPLIISSTAHAEERNTMGIKVGAIKTLDDNQELSYHETDTIFGLFYDRRFLNYLSLEIEAGYIQKSGYEYTESGRVTDIETTLTLVPVSSSIKLNYYFTPLITGYIGAGPDLWYYKEENDYKKIDAFDDDNYGVGGYHGKIGFYLKTADEDIKKEMGVVLECVYSKIDRFGDNEVDLGGVSFNFGIFYMF